jgi:hypothetical protein
MRLALALVLCAACGSDSSGDSPDAGTPDAAPVDPSIPLFDPAHVVEVSIDLGASDWDTLRQQTRSASDVFGSCPDGPHPDPFTYFHAAITVDGTHIADIGLRKKGFYGSLDTEKPSLKVKLDEYVSGQRYLGLKQLTLNNSKQDPSLVKQCLGYKIFNDAGVNAPRCNFAHVTVNGKSLGVYVNVESVNKDFLRKRFANPEGNLYEGAISDFRPGWTSTFDPKTNESAMDTSDLDAVSAALQKPDAELLAALNPVVDVDEFISFWALEALIGHTDSYSGLANNFFAYHDPDSGKFVLMPWGADNTFHDGGAMNSPVSVLMANGLIARRLWLLPETRARFITRLQTLLANVWSETDLLAEIDRMAALTGAPAAEITKLRTWVSGRRAQVADELSPEPVWTAPFKPNGKPCFESNGMLTGTFQTTWGTLGSDPFAAGTGTMTGSSLDGMAITPTQIGAASGPDNGTVTIQVPMAVGGTKYLFVFFNLPAASYAASDIAGFNSAAVWYDASTMAASTAAIAFGGTLHFDAAGATTGAAVRGRYSIPTLAPPF